MTTETRPRRKRRHARVTCPRCGEEMAKGTLPSHLRYACEAIVEEETGDVPPGTVIGTGPEAHKKRWTWADLEKRYPKENWITQVPVSAPPGGIIINGLHVELIANRPGCMISRGGRPGQSPEYVRAIPNPHWDAYQRQLESLRLAQESETLLHEGFGIPTPRTVGPLEPQVFIDPETGDRLVNPY